MLNATKKTSVTLNHIIDVDTYTVNNVGEIAKLWTELLMTEIAVAHAEKNNKICQQRKKAVARSALANEGRKPWD